MITAFWILLILTLFIAATTLRIYFVLEQYRRKVVLLEHEKKGFFKSILRRKP